MKVIWKTILVFLATACMLAAAAFLLPEKILIQRTATIDAPARIVFNQVNDLHCWNKWSTWNLIDPEMKVKYINGGCGNGAGYEWTSENRQVGKGKLLITGSVPYDSIATIMDFMEGGIAYSYFLFKENEGKTSVTWALETHLGNKPLSRWVGLMFEKMMGPDLEKGLNKLNEQCKIIAEEKQPIVDIVRLPETSYAGMKETVTWAEIGPKMEYMYDQIMVAIQKQNLTVTERPFAVYHAMNEGTIELECGIPVRDSFESKNNVLCNKRSAGEYAFSIHKGSYENLETTHTVIQNWITDHELKVIGGPMEIYLTDQQNEPDTTKWITQIYYPLQ